MPKKKRPRITRRALLNTLAATGVGAASRSSTAKAASMEEEKLWIGDAIDFRTMPYVPGIEHVLVHRAVKGEYQWLHGPQIIAHRGVLFTNWANSLVNENSSSEAQRGSRSKDGGRTWSDVEVIAPNLPGRWRRSHGAFWIRDDALYALNGRFGNVSHEDFAERVLPYEQAIIRGGDVFENLQTEAWLLDEQTDKWKYKGIIADRIWPYHEPRRLSDGSWFVAGMGPGHDNGVAKSRDNDRIDRWRVQKIPVEEGILCSEATSWVDGSKEIQVLLRNDTPEEKGGVRRIMISHSTDHGETWSIARPTNFPDARSKAHAGVLSTGQRYLVNNSSRAVEKVGPRARVTGVRWPLTIAVGAPGERTLRKMWLVRDGKTVQPRLEGKGKREGWQYPGVWDHEGNVYVIYSVGKEDCEVAILPLESLSV